MKIGSAGNFFAAGSRASHRLRAGRRRPRGAAHTRDAASWSALPGAAVNSSSAIFSASPRKPLFGQGPARFQHVRMMPVRHRNFPFQPRPPAQPAQPADAGVEMMRVGRSEFLHTRILTLSRRIEKGRNAPALQIISSSCIVKILWCLPVRLETRWLNFGCESLLKLYYEKFDFCRSCYCFAPWLTLHLQRRKNRHPDAEYNRATPSSKAFSPTTISISGKRPGILVVHQWLGLTDYEKRRTAIARTTRRYVLRRIFMAKVSVQKM